MPRAGSALELAKHQTAFLLKTLISVGRKTKVGRYGRTSRELGDLVSNIPNLDLQWSTIKMDLVQQFRGVIISLSGGADSTALFRLFCDFAKQKNIFNVRAIHVNFGLRGEDSEADELFCRDLCGKFAVPLDVRKVSAAAVPESGGIQQWARNIRIELHREYLEKNWIVATGHHQDDLAENIIFRLIRGFSVTQLPGMELWNGRYWRPLLSCPKKELLSYLAELNQPFRHDASNDGRDYTRNKIRHDILPLLHTLAPSATQNICETIGEAAAIGSEFIKITTNNRTQTISGAKISSMDLPTARFLVRAAIYQLTDNPSLRLSRYLLNAIVERLRKRLPGKSSFDISSEQSVEINANQMKLTTRPPGLKQKRLLQYTRALEPLDRTGLVGSGSHLFLRDGDVIWAAEPSGKTKGHSLEFEVKIARSGNKLKLHGWKAGKTVKNTLQELSISPDNRTDCRIITKNGEQFGLFDGEKIISPANLAMQATIAGINFIITKKA